MDKIIALICEEARRRPGKRLVPKLQLVVAQVDGLVSDLIDRLIRTEREVGPYRSLQKGDVNDSGIKRP